MCSAPRSARFPVRDELAAFVLISAPLGSAAADLIINWSHGTAMDFLKPRYIPMSRRRRIYEGKAKVLYEGPEPGTLIQHFKDDVSEAKAGTECGIKIARFDDVKTDDVFELSGSVLVDEHRNRFLLKMPLWRSALADYHELCEQGFELDEIRPALG